MEKMVEYLDFYRGKKVFITGHTGFKGSWLSLWLHQLGAIVKGYALEPAYENSIYDLTSLADNIESSIIDDILNYNSLAKAIYDFQPDIIFHLAAQPLVRYSYNNPMETFKVNIEGTINVLEAIRGLENPCIAIIITTDKVYENKEWLYPYRENDSMGGYDPYSSSKACAEIISQSYFRSFFNPNKYSAHKVKLATARAGNVIGGGDWSVDRIIPDIVRSLIDKEELVLRYPQAVRPWQHVLEPLNGYLKLAHYLNISPSTEANLNFNFGPYIEDSLTVESLVKKAIECWGGGIYSVSSSNVHEAGLLKLDISKALDMLKWRPLINADVAIEMTIDWYKSFHTDGFAIESFTLSQINDFQNRIKA